MFFLVQWKSTWVINERGKDKESPSDAHFIHLVVKEVRSNGAGTHNTKSEGSCCRTWSTKLANHGASTNLISDEWRTWRTVNGRWNEHDRSAVTSGDSHLQLNVSWKWKKNSKQEKTNKRQSEFEPVHSALSESDYLYNYTGNKRTKSLDSAAKLRRCDGRKQDTKIWFHKS